MNAQGGRTVIRNLGDVGKTKVETVTVAVEQDFLFPLLRGRDVQAWRASPSAMILVPHRADDFAQPVSVSDLKRRNPLTFEFFKRFEGQLKARSGYKQLHNARDEFYVVGNVGKYTLAPYKVVFKDLTELFQCAVVGRCAPEPMSGLRPVVPDHTLLFIACEVEDEAYFLAGVLNSIPVRAALYSASVGVQTQRYYPTDVSRVRLPEWDKKDTLHREVCRISRRCHEAAGSEEKIVAPIESEMELAEAVSQIWSISPKEQGHLVRFYKEIQTLRKRGTEVDAGDNE